MSLDPWLVKVIVVVVVIAWLASLIASQLVKGFQMPEALNGLFLAIAGGAVAQQKKGDKGGEDE